MNRAARIVNDHIDHIGAFIDHMAGNGCEPASGADITADDKRHLIGLAGDKKSERALYYRLDIRDGYSLGWYKNCKTGETYNYKNGKEPKRSAEEIAAIKIAREKEKRQREVAEEKTHRRLATRLKRAFNNLPAAGAHPYLTDKGVQPHGIKYRAKGKELIIPIYGIKGELFSVQRISATWKGYFSGGKISGCYFPMATKRGDFSTILIAEGFATAASVREATGLPVVVAFDAGNLKLVAMAMRKKYPDARIVFAADNDQWKFNPKKRPTGLKSDDIAGDSPEWERLRAEGFTYNTGIDKAQQAAAAIGGGIVLAPPFTGSEVHKKNDWNDYAALFGSDAVRAAFDAALAVKKPAADPEPEEYEPTYNYEVMSEPAGAVKMRGDFGMQFKVLGYNERLFYYFPFKGRQIVILSASGHTMNNLFELDEMDNWWRYFGTMENPSPTKIATYAANALIQKAKERGVFKQEDRARGAGAWVDKEKIILHCGDSLFIDGQDRTLDELDSEYTYVASSKFLKIAETALDNKTAYNLRKICEAVTWENPLSGSLLAGWLVIAPICAALEYRPHIYLTGESQSGKSTVLNRVIRATLGKFALRVGGKTSEPSVRQQMGYDARPLIFDEAEPSASITSVIELARLASTGEIVKKFGQNPFNARFCACFSAINPPVNKTADENRISFMVIKKNRKPSAMEDYDNLLTMIKETITEDFGARLIRRTLDNIDTLFKNIDVFQRAFRRTFGDARAAEQIGTMLAGLYLLGRTDVITEAAALEWVGKHHWTDHTIIDQETDPVRLVQHIASSLIRYTNGSEISVAELISMVRSDRDTKADTTLRNYGVAVKDEFVSIASRSQNLTKLLRGTDWETKWSRTLADVDGAVKMPSEYFSRGIRTSAVRLPIALFLEEEVKDFYVGTPEQELDF